MAWKLTDTGGTYSADGFTLSVQGTGRTRIRLQSDVETKSAARSPSASSSKDGASLGTSHGHHSLCDWEVVPRDSSLVDEVAYPLPSERYVRQQDLITVFPQKYPWLFSYQIDVRVLSACKDRFVAELWLSIQTSMLESNPELWIANGAAGATSQADGSVKAGVEPNRLGVWKCHPEYICSADKRSVLVVHPLDRADSRTAASPSGDFEHLELFGRFMEKGVIRRGRVLLIGSRTTLSETTMRELIESFSESSLPLTA